MFFPVAHVRFPLLRESTKVSRIKWPTGGPQDRQRHPWKGHSRNLIHTIRKELAVSEKKSCLQVVLGHHHCYPVFWRVCVQFFQAFWGCSWRNWWAKEKQVGHVSKFGALKSIGLLMKSNIFVAFWLQYTWLSLILRYPNEMTLETWNTLFHVQKVYGLSWLCS